MTTPILNISIYCSEVSKGCGSKNRSIILGENSVEGKNFSGANVQLYIHFY